MVSTLSINEMMDYLKQQLYYFFPDNTKFEGKDILEAIKMAYARCDTCFQYIKQPGYCTDRGESNFYHLHSDQYATFIYFLSNSLWNISENKVICDKLVFLNKCLNSFWVTYKVKLPDIFFLNHPVGTVLGHATYSDFLVVMQNVTVNTGEIINGVQYPILDKGCCLCAGAKIIGSQSIGARVTVGVDSVSYKKDIPSDSILVNIDGVNTIKKQKICNASLLLKGNF